LQGSNACNITAASLLLTNLISGTGSLFKLGSAALVLGAVNSYSGGTFINAGTVILTNLGSIAASSNILVAAGATLNSRSRTDGTLTLAAGQTLSGNGTVQGSVTAAAGSTLSPGTSIGALTVTNAIQLQGTTWMELNKAADTNDVLRGAVSIKFGGTLQLTNLGGTLTAGDSFPLFSASAYSGSFMTLSPAIPALNLGWDTSTLVSDGTLRIINAPTPRPRISGVTLSGSTLVMNGNNGVPGWRFYVLESTNVAAPLAAWTRAATNFFNLAGSFTITNAITPNSVQRFYSLQLAP
jgi:autotransporter-associated beta strand protein